MCARTHTNTYERALSKLPHTHAHTHTHTQERIEATRLFNSKLRQMYAPKGLLLDIASDVSTSQGTVTECLCFAP